MSATPTMFQLCSTVKKFVSASSNVVGIISLLVGKGLTDLLKYFGFRYPWSMYHTCAITTCFWFETALVYKPRILGTKFPCFLHKLLLIINYTENGVKNI